MEFLEFIGRLLPQIHKGKDRNNNKDMKKVGNLQKKKSIRPFYYKDGAKVEMWDYSYQHNLNFFEGNVVKYITRWRNKNGLDDLIKAKTYLDKLIDLETRKKKS